MIPATQGSSAARKDYAPERGTGIIAEPLSSGITEDIQEQINGLWNWNENMKRTDLWPQIRRPA
jgi:hypothetical protein